MLFSFVLNGEYTLHLPLDDSLSLTVSFQNFQGGQYKQVFHRFIPNYCKSLYVEKLKLYYEDFQASLTHPQPWKACPYPPGKNEVHNFVFNDKGHVPPYIPGGEKWRIDVRFIKEKKIMGGYNVYVLVRNEESLLG